jgi:hypothetical protein
MTHADFGAPWSSGLRTLTLTVSALLLALIVLGLALHLPLLAAAALLIACLTLPFAVLGYAITPTQIEVRRLGWSTALPLATLVSVASDPDAMRGSMRIFGNGGFCAITGIFSNAKLGRYRALATDPARAVVLRYPTRIVIVTPHDPKHFVARVQGLIGHAH